jgi:hypothetical protein
MLEPKSRLFHAIVVMGLGVTACGSEPAPIVDASVDAKTQDAKGSDAAAVSDASDAAADVAADAPSDASTDPDACTHVCFGQTVPCSFPCYV